MKTYQQPNSPWGWLSNFSLFYFIFGKLPKIWNHLLSNSSFYLFFIKTNLVISYFWKKYLSPRIALRYEWLLVLEIQEYLTYFLDKPVILWSGHYWRNCNTWMFPINFMSVGFSFHIHFFAYYPGLFTPSLQFRKFLEIKKVAEIIHHHFHVQTDITLSHYIC